MKQLLTCLLILSLVLSLCACGSSSTETKPVETKPVETTPAKTEPVKTEPVKTEPVKTEPTQTEPVWTEPGERIRGDYDLIAPYLAIWSHEELDGFIRINEDWTWELLDAQGSIKESGECSYLDGYLILEQEDGTDWDFLYFGEDGSLYNSASMEMHMDELPEPDDVGVEYYPYVLPATDGYSELACQIYEEIYPMIVNLEDFSYSSADCEPSYLEALSDACNLIYNRHPETRMYFRLDDTFDEQDNQVLSSVYFWDREVNADKELIRRNLDDFEDQAARTVAKILNSSEEDMTAEELYLRLSEYVCASADYDFDNKSGAPNSPWAGIMGGTCLSEGYAAALQYLCSEANLYCEVVHGYSRDAYHDWNLVKLPSGEYYIDLTWADQAGEPESIEWMNYYMMTLEQTLIEHEFLEKTAEPGN